MIPIHSTPPRERECHGRGEIGQSHISWGFASIRGHPALSAPSPRAVGAQDLATGDAAFMQQRFTDAQRAYRAMLATAPAIDRKEAALALAVIDWKIDGDTARAMRDLRPFIATSPALTMASRARLDAHNVSGARSAARAAIATAKDAEERRDAEVALGDAALARTKPRASTRRRPRPRAHPRASVAREASARLRASGRRGLGHLDASERLVRLAAIAGDWRSLALGWRSYYAVGRRVPGGPLVRAESELDSMAHDAPARKAGHAYAAFVDSKMFQPAALIATCGALASSSPSAETPGDRCLRALPAQCHARHERLLSQRRARPRGCRPRIARRSTPLGMRLWPHLVWKGSEPAYDLNSLERDARAPIRSRRQHRATPASVMDLHAGHRDLERGVATCMQYGKRRRIVPSRCSTG